MRWRIIDPHNQQEQAERARITAKIDAWWKHFQQATGDLDALFSKGATSAFKSTDDLARWIKKHLQGIHPSLMWEFGSAIQCDGHRLVITPESAGHLRPLTKTILKRAPQIAGWEFYAYRLPESVAATHGTVKARTGYDSNDFQLRLSRGEQNRVNIYYCSPRITSSEDKPAFHAAFVATETLLGEEYLDKWVGAIEIGPLKKSSGLGSLFSRGTSDTKHLIPLDRMKETFDAVVQSIRDQLPPGPHLEWVENTEWSVYQLIPQKEDDYPAQDDIFVGTSANVAMWSATRQPTRFYSEQFSRCGEVFCFVKIDGLQGLSGSEFADKAEIEVSLDETLKSQKLGCVIGGGSGLRYSYVELALADLGHGLQTVRKRLRSGNVPERSWIQFHESDFAAEWVGIYDDTPPPPMPTFDE